MTNRYGGQRARRNGPQDLTPPTQGLSNTSCSDQAVQKPTLLPFDRFPVLGWLSIIEIEMTCGPHRYECCQLLPLFLCGFSTLFTFICSSYAWIAAANGKVFFFLILILHILPLYYTDCSPEFFFLSQVNCSRHVWPIRPFNAAWSPQFWPWVRAQKALTHPVS